MSWKLTCRDAGDGSGDVILDLPDDLLKAACNCSSPSICQTHTCLPACILTPELVAGGRRCPISQRKPLPTAVSTACRL